MKTFLITIFTFILATNFAYAANTVDLIWEGETYVPTFYAGRPLPTPGNLNRVVAIPVVSQNGQRLTSSQLTFHWIKDFNPIQSASGRGKNVLEYRVDPTGAPSTVSVEVAINQGERVAENRITINPSRPKVLLSRVQPLTNPTRLRALTGLIPINPTETTLLAQPFFFSLIDLANRRLAFDWRVNGASVPNQRDDARFFTVAAPTSGEGQATLAVTARNGNTPPQTASQTITLGFGLRDFTF